MAATRRRRSTSASISRPTIPASTAASRSARSTPGRRRRASARPSSPISTPACDLAAKSTAPSRAISACRSTSSSTSSIVRWRPCGCCATRRSRSGEIGAGEHTDYGNITLLATDGVGGLEVRTRDGQWLAAPSIEGAFVVNIGDCLMRWTNDVYVSTPHRVVSRGAGERYSIAFFLDPHPLARVEAIPSCVPAGAGAEISADPGPRIPALALRSHLSEGWLRRPGRSSGLAAKS